MWSYFPNMNIFHFVSNKLLEFLTFDTFPSTYVQWTQQLTNRISSFTLDVSPWVLSTQKVTLGNINYWEFQNLTTIIIWKWKGKTCLIIVVLIGLNIGQVELFCRNIKCFQCQVPFFMICQGWKSNPNIFQWILLLIKVEQYSCSSKW